jgi:tryptophanyl-tRNA synthetase
MKTVFSGIQPTGELHLGNYLGAIRNWVKLQDEYRGAIFCVVDYHALTKPYDAKEMAKTTFDMVTEILALGVDPEKALLFIQSMVPEHTELCWVLVNVVGIGHLERMTQYKDKSQHQAQEQEAEHVNAGLLIYPVLQAADIMLYKADVVPVGQDQVQHIELARSIARSFNDRWGKVFPVCEVQLTNLPKLLGTKGDGKKMSKSLNNHIPLSIMGDDKKLSRALAQVATDSKRVSREDPGNPDDCQLIAPLHKEFSSPEDNAWVREGCTTAGIGCSDCKKKLAENMKAHFAPYVARRAELVAHPEKVTAVLEQGAAKAGEIAKRTMGDVRKSLGLWRPRG